MDTTRASLLLRVRDHADMVAWRDFDAIYRPLLHRFAASCGLRHADAEDVVQHCMAAVHQHIAGFDYDPSKGRFKGWLKTLVNNRVRSMLRERHEKNAGSQAFERSDHHTPGPEAAFDQIWMEEHLAHCLKQLRQEVEPSSFAAFQAYVVEEHPVEEVCQKLGMNRDQLYAIKYRLLNKLRGYMAELTGEDA